MLKEREEMRILTLIFKTLKNNTDPKMIDMLRRQGVPENIITATVIEAEKPMKTLACSIYEAVKLELK